MTNIVLTSGLKTKPMETTFRQRRLRNTSWMTIDWRWSWVLTISGFHRTKRPLTRSMERTERSNLWFRHFAFHSGMSVPDNNVRLCSGCRRQEKDSLNAMSVDHQWYRLGLLWLAGGVISVIFPGKNGFTDQETRNVVRTWGWKGAVVHLDH